MGEADPVAFDRDDSVALGGLQELDHLVGACRFTDKLDRRRGKGCGGEQHVVDGGIQVADPGPNQLGQRGGQFLTGALEKRAAQFDGIERISG